MAMSEELKKALKEVSDRLDEVVKITNRGHEFAELGSRCLDLKKHIDKLISS